MFVYRGINSTVDAFSDKHSQKRIFLDCMGVILYGVQCDLSLWEIKMTKKIEKEFWVSDSALENMRDNKEPLASCDTRLFTFHGKQFEKSPLTRITISWEAPEKKITLSESQFEVVMRKWQMKTAPWTTDDLKTILFGGGE